MMFAMKTSILLIPFLVFTASGDIASKESSNSVTESSQSIQSGIESLEAVAPGLQKIMSLPEINEGEDILKEKCDKYGHNESFNLAMEARLRFELCVSNLVDVKQLQTEITAAKPTGDLDTVFRKYCRKTPIVKECLEDLLNGTASCFSENERSQVTVLQNVTDSLMKFICFKEGDRIALFIAEEGPECLAAKWDAVQLCLNSTVTSAQATMVAKNISTDEIPDFVFDSEKCGHFTEIQKCVVQVLEECSEPTPANIVGSLFDFVRKSTPCMQYYKTATGASNSLSFSVMSFFLPLGALVLSRI